MKHEFLSPKDVAEITGLPYDRVREGCVAYINRTKGFVGWGLPAPKRGEVPCVVAGCARSHIRVIPKWAFEKWVSEVGA
jgi:hypothetical protein